VRKRPPCSRLALWSGLWLVGILPGGVGAQTPPPSAPAGADFVPVQPAALALQIGQPPPPPGGVVFVANGSGGLHTASEGLRRALAGCGAPLQVECVDWSHGAGLFLLDHLNRHNHHTSARNLATAIKACRERSPGTRVYLVGHSTGCAVILGAAGLLPPGSVDRIILLSPSVSPEYDLRPALTCACEGIDVFLSHRDYFFLGVGMRLIGTSDGRLGSAGAGRKGFRPTASNPADAELFTRLRQHAWDPSHSWTGHSGGHYGNNRTEFLRTYVVPLLCGGAAPVAEPPAPAVPHP
jgi:pimeloyl-ACP methyl ester carboxylesterase